MTVLRPNNLRQGIAASVLIAGVLASAMLNNAMAETWAPVASERLMRLPGESLEKAIENDYAKSGLAQEMIGVEEQIGFKQLTLQDMQQAVERTDDGEQRAVLQSGKMGRCRLP